MPFCPLRFERIRLLNCMPHRNVLASSGPKRRKPRSLLNAKRGMGFLYFQVPGLHCESALTRDARMSGTCACTPAIGQASSALGAIAPDKPGNLPTILIGCRFFYVGKATTMPANEKLTRGSDPPRIKISERWPHSRHPAVCCSKAYP